MDTLYLSPGGIKGYSILGVITVLEKKNLLKNFKTIIGNSVGSIIGLLIILGYNSKSIYKLLLKNLEHFFLKHKIENENIILNLINDFGINNGEGYKKLLEYFLKEKNLNININFKELYEKTNIDFIVITSDIKNIDLFYFSKDNTPNISVLTSIMASTCIPFIFKPIFYENRILVDGGYFNNIKLKYINSKTLVVNIINESNYLNISDDINLFEYSKLLINSLIKSVQNISNYDSTNIISLKFEKPGITINISNENRKEMYIYGIEKTLDFFKQKELLKKYFIIIKNNLI